LLKISIPTQEDTQLVMPTARFGTVEVTADGEGLVSHAGVGLLVELADRVGLTDAMSAALADTRERRSAHDPGRVLRDVAVMLADGGDCVTDMDAYRGQERLFGARASETTTHRPDRAGRLKTMPGQTPQPLPETRYRIVCYEIEDDQQTIILDATAQAFIAATGTIDENNTMRGKGTPRRRLPLQPRLARVIADDQQLAD
jgi:hypothetical protein